MKNRVLLLVLIITLLFSWGCAKNNDIKLDNIENTENVVRELEDVIALQLNAIKEGNIDKYMSTINQSEVEYVAERKSWFRDAVANNIDSLSIKLIKTETIVEDEILAQLLQTYKFNGKAYMLNYSLRFIKQNDRWLDSGLDFKTIETDHFAINYPQGLAENAILASQGAEEAYNNIVDRLGLEPKDKTVVKLYDDKELLRQSVKLSFGWQFAGWYEFPESIKTMVYGTKDDYRKVIEHELTHKITIGLSNNNMPYWLSEGLAMYYTEYYNKDFRISKEEDITNIWSIEELEKLNLETMTDNREIHNYYLSSGVNVQLIASEFGEDKLIEVLKELGKFSYQEGTSIEINEKSKDIFRKLLPKVLGITVKELDEKLKL